MVNVRARGATGGLRFPLSHAALTLALLGCNAGDLSAALGSGRCDSAGLCATGYMCEQSSWRCVALGASSSGGTGVTSTSSSIGGTSLTSAGATSTAGIGGTSFTSAGATSIGGLGAAGGAPDVGGGPGTTTGGNSVIPATGGSASAGGTSSTQSTACTTDGCPCADGHVLCGGSCLELTDVQHCGACSNRCDLLGSRLTCDQDPLKGCSCAGDDTKCGDDPAATKCGANGACECSGVACARGEICRADAKGVPACSCDGAAACRTGLSCCQGKGCLNLSTAETDCGSCGHTCPTGFRCNAGTCRCGNNIACDPSGTAVCSPTGFCQCNGVVCSAGQRCVAAGVCG